MLYDILINAKYDTFNTWKKSLRNNFWTSRILSYLIGIPQSTHYHPEFDVALHTYYVCKAIFTSGKYHLIEAAFLHDIGKVNTTNVGKNRIYHFGHDIESIKFIEGYISLKENIKNYNLTKNIILNHMSNSKNISDDLKFFIYADKKLSRKIYMIENSVFSRYINKIKEKLLYFKQQFSSKKVIILIGIPGSGKSRYTKKFDNKYVVCPDNIRKEFTGDISDQSQNEKVWEEALIRMKIILLKYNMVILDATNVDRFSRIKLLSNFNGCKKIAVIFNSSVEVAIDRIKNDIKNGIDRSNVPDNVVRKKYKSFIDGISKISNEFNKVIYYKD